MTVRNGQLIHFRRQLRPLFVIMVVCAAVGVVFERVDTGSSSITGPLTGLVASLPLIVFEVLFPLKYMRRWPFALSVLAKALLYVGLIWLVFLGAAFVYGAFHAQMLSDLYSEAWSTSTLSKIAVASCTYVIIIFFRQLDRLLGPGTLIRYLFGRYHHPRREDRIFMFLDVKGATAIAEQLDSGAYYALLNDFFHDIAEPVLATRAEIYQHVGDQVVLTWPMATGLRNGNCIRVFFEIDRAVQRHGQNYLTRYGLVPEYKAAVYGGEVIRAEIGDLKRDLIYSGDVLNTTARIQSECNRFNARLLASSALLERLMLPPGVVAEELGFVMLRGKRDPLALVRLSRAGDEMSPGPPSDRAHDQADVYHFAD